MREEQLKTTHGTIYYWVSENWDSGQQTLLFLHGLTADHTMFAKQFAVFRDRYNLITWDAPAHGKSRPYADFSYPEAVEALRTILLRLGVGSAVFIGQSFGGFLAQSFLLRYPTMVQAFIGIDTTPYGEGYYAKLDKWCLRRIEGMAKLFPCALLKRSIAKQNSVTEEGYRNMRSMLERYGKAELCHLMGIGYAGFLQENRELSISCPVLLLLGERDRTGKVRQYNLEWAKRTSFPLIVIRNAAHNSNVDNPGEVNRAIAQFLEQRK